MEKKLRLMTILLALVLALSACQPTPEEEVVVNKGDRVLEEKISAVSPAQNSTEDEGEATAATVHQYTFPDRWEEVYDAGNGLTLTFNADIVQREDGIYPVYRTRPRELDAETFIGVLNALLPAPVSMHETGMTKDDWKERMEMYVDDMEERLARLQLPPEERGDGDDTPITQEEIDAELQWYAEQIAAAPDSLDEVEVTDFSGVRINAGQVYRLSDGDMVYINSSDDFFVITRTSSDWGAVVASYDREEREEEYGLVWTEVTIDQDVAVAQARETLDKLGFEDFAMMEVYEANYIGDEGLKHPVSGGYTMRFKREYGGYPLVTRIEPAQHFNYGEDDGFNANAYIYEEYIDVYVDESGVRSLEYSGSKEVRREENPSVELLDFETIQERVRKVLTYGLTGLEKKVEVYEMMLTVNTQRVANSDEYYEVPCWLVCYDSRDYSYWKTEEEVLAAKARLRSPTFCVPDCVYINAIDGTVFSFDYGR